MAEIQDSDFLRILQETEVVSPEQVRSAQELQRSELDRQGSCRTLFSILCAKGLIDERVARSLRPSTREGLPGDVTPHTPTVVLPPPDETPSDVRRVNQPSTISGIRSARKRPPEVETAAVNPKNTLGPYILVREVGKGGMGRVYYAWDENVGRFVALKVIDTEDQADRERFVREAQIAGRLSHPSIATVYHAGEVETRGYIAMQFIDGGPIDARKLPLLSALALIRDAAHALSYAHEHGVVHRDVKPGNLMVDGQGHVFLTDFGLAKEVVADAGTQLSITGTTFGTPQYMSPEQARGEHKKIDGRSDVYSLGATLYALLAGRPPFTSKNLATLLLEVLDKKPPPVSRFNKEISPELQMLVERAMSKDPEKRFPTMTAFAEALDRMIREGRYAGRYGMAKALARRWVPRLAATAALGAALWFGVPFLLAPPNMPPAPPAPPADPAPGIYASAVAALRTLENQPLTVAERRERIAREVIPLLDKIPRGLRSDATRIRALYAQGERELPEVTGDDYRLQWVAALLALEKALQAPCPMPALESPGFEWEKAPAPWPEALVAAVDRVARATVAPDLREEYAKDKALIDGLAALTEGRGGKDVDALRGSGLPVFAAAWCRAAYLARRFAEVRDASESKDRRERFGAELALAAGSSAGLQALLGEAGADGASIHAALARMEGVDPVEPHVVAGLKGAAPEREAALVSARLQHRALTGADDEQEYRRAMGLAGESPSTWPGRLAAIELRLGLGSRTRNRPLLEEAAKRADELSQKAPGWAPPRLLGAQARLRLGRLDEAKAELSRLKGESRKGLRACLIASAVELAAADRDRKAGGSGVEAAKASQQEALAAPGDPVEASMLWGAAALLLAQDAADRGKDESDFVAKAVESLSRAIERVPEYGEARYHRALAMFLRVGIAQRKGGDGRAEFEGMRADAAAALSALPEHLPARYLRGIANYHLGKNAEAIADWRAVIKADPAYDGPALQSWIQEAERKLKK